MESRRVLVVDDDADVRELVRLSLERVGVAVRTASDGDGCLREAATWQPDLVLLDVVMPGESGIAVLARLRGSAGARAPQVALLTCRAPEEADALARLDVAGVIAKPFSLLDLPSQVARTAGWPSLPPTATAEPWAPPLERWESEEGLREVVTWVRRMERRPAVGPLLPRLRRLTARQRDLVEDAVIELEAQSGEAAPPDAGGER
jgi:two-component system, OmpR family, response regulator